MGAVDGDTNELHLSFQGFIKSQRQRVFRFLLAFGGITCLLYQFETPAEVYHAKCVKLTDYGHSPAAHSLRFQLGWRHTHPDISAVLPASPYRGFPKRPFRFLVLFLLGSLEKTSSS